jgi:hypothetical protein
MHMGARQRGHVPEKHINHTMPNTLKLATEMFLQSSDFVAIKHVQLRYLNTNNQSLHMGARQRGHVPEKADEVQAR